MKTNQIPKTVQKWIDSNQDIAGDAHMEDDFAGPGLTGIWSIWMTLRDGYVLDDGSHVIHASTVPDFKSLVATITKEQSEGSEGENMENEKMEWAGLVSVDALVEIALLEEANSAVESILNSGLTFEIEGTNEDGEPRMYSVSGPANLIDDFRNGLVAVTEQRADRIDGMVNRINLIMSDVE